MNNLIEKIAAYKHATQSLIEKTKEYEAFIKNNIPFEFWKRFGLSKFGGGQFTERHISVNGKAIPGYTDKFGKSLYWAGDFNYYTEYVTGRELTDWCKQLPSLIKKANDYISTLTGDAGIVTSEINL